MSLTASISTYMSPNPITLLGTQGLREARALFSENRFKLAPIVDEAGHLAGVLSASDLLASPVDDNSPIASLMTTDIVTVGKRSQIADAASVLSDCGVHHLVVLGDQDRPIGVLSTLDITAALADAGLTEPIEVLTHTGLIGLDPDTSVGEARLLLKDAAITSAPVVDATGSVVGALTQLALVTSNSDSEMRVDAVMEPVVTVHRSQTISNVAQLLAEEGLHRIFVVADQGDVIGVVTSSDLTRYAAGVHETSGD